MTTDTSLLDAVIASLSRDPRISDPALIAVSADDGMVVLCGTVESFGQRRAAGQDAHEIALQQTHGAYEVDNRLKVNLLGRDRREDREIRGAALQSLMSDADVPSDSIDVKVHNGWVTLIGNVRHQYQSNAAYEDVARLYGVIDITNEIRVKAL